MPTFGYTGSVQTYDVSSYNEVLLRLTGPGGEDGQDGNNPGGQGGQGGEIDVIADVSGLTSLDIYTGGGAGNTWGHYDGGLGGDATDSTSGDGGNGAGRTAVVGDDGTVLAAADGGGAAGGLGGGGPGQNGEDAGGTGEGGDGGDGNESNSDGSPGTDGGYSRDSGLTTLQTATVGGGATGNGSVDAEPLPTEPDNVQQDVEDDDTVTVTGDEGANSGPVDTYEIEIKTDGGSWTLVASPSGGGSFSHTETIARATDTVQFRVRAVNSAGSSDWVYTTTQSTNATGLGIDAVDATSIDLSWTDPDANDGTDVLLAESTGSTAADYSVDQSVGATAASATISDLEHGERYYARVQATYSGADGTPAPVSNEVDTITDLPAPTIVSIDASTLRELTLEVSIPDNSTDGDVLVERSTDGGSTWTEVGTITDLSASTWTDTGLLDGEVYTYRLTRRTDHATAQSGTASARTILSVMIDVAVESVGDDSAVVTAQDTANHKDGYRVDLSTDGGSTWTQAGGDLAPQYALRFDAAEGDTVSAPHDSSIEPQSDLSCFARVHVADTGSNQVIAREWGGTDGGPFLFQIDTGGTLRLSVGNGTDRTSSITVPVGTDTDVGVILDDSADEATFYVDGTTETVGFADSPVTTGSNPFICGDFFGNRYFDGELDDLAFATSLKDQSDWDAYRDGAESPSNFDRYYAFDDGPGSSTATDSSGNGNDATLNGPGWVSPIAPIRRSLDGLRNGEQYDARWSVFTEHEEVFSE